MPTRFLALVLAAAGLAACGTPFEVELPERTPRLVVQGLFAADSAIVLGLGRSASATGAPPTEPVTDARVQLFEDGALVGQAAYVPSRLRYVSAVRARPGRTYRVRAEAPGFEPVEAQDTVPLPTPFQVDVAGTAEDGVDAVTARFAAAPAEAFYALYGLVERAATPQQAAGVAPLVFRSTDPLLTDGDLSGLVADVDDPFYVRAFFRALPTGSPEVAIRLNVRRPSDPVTERLRLATLSPTYYAYARALDGDPDGGAFGSARDLPSNVEGGYGIFAAFAAAERVLPTP